MQEDDNVFPLQGNIDDFRAQLDRLKTGGGGGTSGGMEERVTRLETRFDYMQRDLTSIDGKLDKVNDRLMQLATKSELKTWQWQWIATGIAIVALTIGGITGGLALIAKFAN